MKKISNKDLLSKFIILQPIIDIITSIMIREFNLSISIGMIIRFIFLLYAGIYILRSKNKHSYVYLAILILYMTISMVGNVFIKTNFNIIKQLIFFVKYLYFPIVLLFFYNYFKDKKLLNLNTFTSISLIMVLSLIISIITNTSYSSYLINDNPYEVGFLAWFNSSNEISVILSILFGITIINFIRSKTNKSYIYVLLIALFLCLIGTKTAIISLMGILITYIIYYFISLLFDKNRSLLINKIIILIPIIVVSSCLLNVLPIHTNIMENYKYANTNLEKDQEDTFVIVDDKSDVSNDTEVTMDTLVSDQMIFNGRYSYLVVNKELYKKSNIFNKIFGITEQGNYYNNQEYYRTNERDMHDLLIHYGVIGLIVSLTIPFILYIKVLVNIIKNKKLLLNDDFIIVGIINALTILVSYTAGHIFFSPAVAIYYAYIIIYLYKLSGGSYE